VKCGATKFRNERRTYCRCEAAVKVVAHVSRTTGDQFPERISTSVASLVGQGFIPNSAGLKLPSSQVNWRTGRPEFARHPHQVGKGIRFHFVHDLSSVRLYRDFADTELAANLFIQQP
jgi:hypothetical protein